MSRNRENLLMTLSAAFLCVITLSLCQASQTVTAVVVAYQPEWEAILPIVSDRREEKVGDITFVKGIMAGAPVVVAESGVGPVNAAISAQIAIDRYEARRLVVIGIAGGVDPNLHIGDVIVPGRWNEYLMSVFARSTPRGFELPPFATNTTTHYGMIFPQDMEGSGSPKTATMRWLDVDAGLLSIARAAAKGVTLARCDTGNQCLRNTPKIVLGGNGVSGSAFVDNAAFRNWLRETYDAGAVDMESAAVAHVASSNRIPFVAFRSLSDLAGAGGDPNEMRTFQTLAAKNAASLFQAFMQQLTEAAASR